MITYHLYLIQGDIARTYFGREHLLYDLFARCHRTNSFANKKMLYKQIQYISEPLQTSRLHHSVEQSLSFHPHYKRINNQHILIQDEVTYGSLCIKRQFARIESIENYEIETMFFEILRKSEYTFLAMDFIHEKYGWLNPIKQVRRYV